MAKNILYFEGASMRELHEAIEKWQDAHINCILSLSIERDASAYYCIALTGPVEVTIVDHSGNRALVSDLGHLLTANRYPTEVTIVDDDGNRVTVMDTGRLRTD